jgi:hypothetical protein
MDGHMKRRLKGSLVSVALLALLGCDDGDGGNGGDGGPGGDGDGDSTPHATRLSADMDRYVRGFCSKAIGCGAAPEESLETCVASFAPLFCEPVYESITLPGVDGCVAALTCELFEGIAAVTPAACRGTYDAIGAARGYKVVQVGQACSGSYAPGAPQCSNDSYCDAERDQCGTCVARKADGAPCESLLECSSFNCGESGTCEARRPLGGDCDSDLQCAEGACILNTCAEEAPGAGCESSDDCRTGYCEDGTCVPLRANGDSCDSDEQCDTACVEGKCMPTAACGSGEAGDPCYTDLNCQDGLQCSLADQRCVEGGAPGDPCDVSEADCADRAFCEPTPASDDGTSAGTCRALKQVGQPCSSLIECETRQCGASGLCEAPPTCG